MNAREEILLSIRKNKPDFIALPEIPGFDDAESDLREKFISSAEYSGTTILTNPDILSTWIKNQFPDARQIISLTDEVSGNFSLTPNQLPSELQRIEVTVIYSFLGVAENGAVWISEKEMQCRILPFITEHLIILLHQSDIVGNMHQAYGKIDLRETGFGVFVGGPSKTADIEQSLVVGAQGTRSHTVVIL